MGACGHPLCLTKYPFFVLCMTGGIQTSSKYMGASKHLSFSSQTHSHLPRLVSHHLHKKNLHSFILTQLDDGSHLEFCHVGFRHCHLGFRHLVIFSQIHSRKHSLYSWLWLIQSDSNSFIITQLDDGSHLEFCHVGFIHLVFFSEIHSKTLSLHSDSDSN